jgi:hypothetical protein
MEEAVGVLCRFKGLLGVPLADRRAAGIGARGRVVVWRPLAANVSLNRDRSDRYPHHRRDDATRADGRRVLREPLSATGNIARLVLHNDAGRIDAELAPCDWGVRESRIRRGRRSGCLSNAWTGKGVAMGLGLWKRIPDFRDRGAGMDRPRRITGQPEGSIVCSRRPGLPEAWQRAAGSVARHRQTRPARRRFRKNSLTVSTSI